MGKYFRLILLLLFSANLFAAELIVIQTVSKTGKTFVTRRGKGDGVSPGVKGTFTGKNVSVIARAKKVTRNYTLWEIDNENAKTPFIKDEIVTYHNTDQYIWTLMPEETRKKFVKELLFKPTRAFVFKTSLSRGLSQSTSEVAASESEIGGYMLEALYEKQINKHISWAAGIRLEQEIINVNEASLTSSRRLALVQFTYYLEKMQSFYQGQLYGGLDFGYGISETEAPGELNSGSAMILPGVRLGLQLPLGNSYRFLFETALESLQIEEGSEIADSQTTNQLNFKYGIGVKKLF